jgi:MFS family permease
MNTLKRFLGVEWKVFRFLDHKAKVLLVSFGIGELASPAFRIFVNAYLLREYTSFTAPILYNVGTFVGIWVGTLCNGILLRRFSSAKLYVLGTILQSVSLVYIIMVHPGSLFGVLVVGTAYGIGSGVYYGNRNFLTLSANPDKDRDYFVALELSSAKVLGIIAPALIGWLLVFGDFSGLYSIAIAYRGLAVAAFVLQVISGWIVARHSYATPSVRPLFLRGADRQWQRMRLFVFLAGLFDGLDWFVPTLLVLVLIGNEAQLGTLQSVGMAITALVLYWIGRKTVKKDRPRVLVAGVICICLGTGVLALSYSATTAIAWVLAVALGTSFFSQAWSTLLYMAADDEIHGDKRYAKLFDSEAFLNAGRIIGVMLFFGAFALLGQQFALRFVPFALGLALIGTIGVSRLLTAEKQT